MKKRAGIAFVIFAAALAVSPARAETPEEWAKLGARVHGGYGALIPLGVRIGLDAVEKLKAEPRTLAVTYFDNPKAPCACMADGVAIATFASFGQRTLTLAAEPAPEGMAAVIVIRPRKGGEGIRYSVPFSAMPKLVEMNKTLEPLQRHDAVMKAEGLFTAEAVR